MMNANKEKDWWDRIVPIIILVLMGFTILGLAVKISGRNSKETKIKEKEIQVVPIIEEIPDTVIVEDFSEEILIEYLKTTNIKFPDVVLAQAKLETGNFTSKIFLTLNNLFGMKRAYIRPSSSLKDSLGYAKFEDWRFSVLDYALYQSYFLKQYKNKEEYLEAIGRSYAEDKLYVAKLNKIMLATKENFD